MSATKGSRLKFLSRRDSRADQGFVSTIAMVVDYGEGEQIRIGFCAPLRYGSRRASRCATLRREPCEYGLVKSDGDGGPAEEGAPVESEIDESDDDGGFDRWRKESALGGIGTGIARGLQSVFAPRADEVVIVAAVPGEPPDADQRLRVVLDPDDPTKSVAIMPESAADPPSG
jgi:hypothetical protein